MSKLKHKETKYVYRLSPCPAYDIEGTESWLSDMAASGYLLSKDGFFAGLAIFEKVNSCIKRYRLEAAPQKLSMWADNNGVPSDEAVELSEYYGWQYVATRGQFYIFCTDSPDARELNTDPKVQALALDMVKKRERTNMVSSILWALVYPIVMLHGNLLLTSVSISTWFMLWAAVLVFWILGRSVSKVMHLRKLRKKLMLGEMPNHKKNWRHHYRQYQLSRIVFLMLLTAWFGLLLIGWSNDVMDTNEKSLENYTGEFPFATMADFAPEGTYRLNDLGLSNTVEIRSDWLAPTIISFKENATVSLKNGDYLSGGLYVDYYDTNAAWIAREIAREYTVERKNSKDYDEYNLKNLNIDYAAAFLGYFPAVIMQEGNKVVLVTFYQTSANYEIQLDEWAQIFADSIKG